MWNGPEAVIAWSESSVVVRQGEGLLPPVEEGGVVGRRHSGRRAVEDSWWASGGGDGDVGGEMAASMAVS